MKDDPDMVTVRVHKYLYGLFVVHIAWNTIKGVVMLVTWLHGL